MKPEMLKKHHFWILFGVVPLIVGLVLILMLTGPADAIDTQAGEYKKRADETAAAQAPGVGLVEELGKQKTTLEERRGQLWNVNYERQKTDGLFTWPIANRDKYLTGLEKLDLKFGAKEVQAIDAAKDADNQFLVLNDEMLKFTESANYVESYNKIATMIAPTRFEGGGWQSVLRYVTDWRTGRPNSDLFWLALEDYWIQRALLKPIADVNASAARFELIKPTAGTAETLLKRKFQSRTWELDIELATEGPNRNLKSKLKNRTDRLQMLGLNKTMRLNVWFDDPKQSTSQPFEYRIGGELVKGNGELAPKVVPEIHKIPAGSNPVEIFKVEQILDEVTVPVRLVRKVELGYRDSKRASAELKMPAFFPDEAAATLAGGENPSGPPQGMTMTGGPLASPGGSREGEGLGGGGVAAGGSARVGTPEAVLLGNRKRYLERTEQIRRMPVGLSLVVDQAFVNDVLIELGNSPLRIQITQTQWQRFRDSLASGTSTLGAPAMPGPVRPGPLGSSGGEEEHGSYSPPAPGLGGTSSALPQTQVTAGLVELAIYGIVSLYEKTKPKPTDGSTEPKPEETKPQPNPGNPKPGDPKPETKVEPMPGDPKSGEPKKQ